MNISKPIKYAVDNDDDNFIHKKDTLQIMTTNKQQNLNLRMSVESNIDTIIIGLCLMPLYMNNRR